MIEKKIFSEIKFILFLIICFIALFLRIYQLNFEDYWLDEQTSFWTADPFLSLNETVKRSFDLEGGTHITFNLILKKFFLFFSYDPQIGRFLPLIFGFLSIPALSYLTFQIQKGKSYVFVAFLSSINFYLISYSQEVRPYSLIFLLSILSIIFFYKVFNNKISLNKKVFYSILYILVSLLGVCIHIFFFIIIISQITYLLLNYFFIKKKIIFNFVCIICVVIFYFLLMFESLLLQLRIDDFWITQIEPEFFINYYFSRFFGSKIMGAIYLFVFLVLIFLSKKKIFHFSNKNFFLLILFLFSYLLPITYGFLQQPLLTDRYIIFVLVPIFILISNLTLCLKNEKIKYFIIFLIIISSLTNNYIEIFERKISKPQFNKSFEYIANSNIKNVLIKSPRSLEKIIINYAENTKTAKKNNLIFYKLDDKFTKLNKLWMTCYKPINGFDCSPEFNLNTSWTESDKIEYHLIKSTLYAR